MNTIVSASATLIGIFIIETLYGKRTFNKLEKHDDVSGSDHKRLSDEHNELKNNSNNILQIGQKIDNKLIKMDKMLEVEKESKQMKFDSLSEKQKEMKNSLDKIVGFADEWERVSFQNTRLRREFEELQQENQALRAENRKLRDRIDDLEQDNEYEK
ncbi:MAG: hypothetical protein ACYDG2_24665 [Ruminiclostridium sp.]